VKPPPGHTLRRPARHDVAPVTDLIRGYELRHFAETAETTEARASRWALPRFALEQDAWLVEDDAGRPAGYGSIYDFAPHVDMHAELYVHEAAEDRGVDDLLLRLIEERGREHIPLAPGGATVRVAFYVAAGDERRHALLATTGYERVRSSHLMVITLEDSPLSVEPAVARGGIALQGLRRGHDEPAVHACIEEAFSEHFRYTPQPFAEFELELVGHERFDPELWVVAWDGDEVAGVVGTFAYPGGAEIDIVAVRHAWRGRGIGLALLGETFVRLATRGATTAYLYVDAANETGALQLYGRAGLRVAQTSHCLMKDLRPAGAGA
jgi:mycothiol synthase